MKLRYLLHLEHRGDCQLGRGQAEVVVNEDEDDDGDDDGVVSDQGPDLDRPQCHHSLLPLSLTLAGK